MNRHSILLGCFLLALSACSSSKPPQATAAIPATQTSKSIIGVWNFVSNVGEATSADKKTKIILDKHWMFSQPDPTNNITLFHHGGTYSLDGNSYAETIEYANASTGGYLGKTFKYEVKIEGDTMTLKGPYSEIWTRAK